MKKKMQIVSVFLWGLAAAGSRILYFLLGRQPAVDTYEYFANAMIRAEKSIIPFTSGLAYAYTEALSGFLRFAGNRIEAVCAGQMVLQILWLLFLAAGISMLFGKLAGIISATILAALPPVPGSIMTVSAENFYMLHLSLNLILLGLFYMQTQKAGWFKSSLCEFYLMLAGFYLGVIWIWNYTGWCLLALVLYILVRNHFTLKDRMQEQKKEKEPKPWKQIMGAGWQACLLLAGAAVGMYATLMKYTGLTGQSIAEQFQEWIFLLRAFPGRCQDISIWLMPALAGAVLAGILCGQLATAVRNRADGKNKEDAERKPQEKDRQEVYVFAEDGRRIKLLDNPLPTPKKHVRREMDFDFDIPEGDDFDL